MKVKRSSRSQTPLSENRSTHIGRVCHISLVSLGPRCHSYCRVRRRLARRCYLFGAQRSSQCSQCFSLPLTLFTLPLSHFIFISVMLYWLCPCMKNDFHNAIVPEHHKVFTITQNQFEIYISK